MQSIHDGISSSRHEQSSIPRDPSTRLSKDGLSKTILIVVVHVEPPRSTKDAR
jgi:hypothetical protein